jgi:hypothetical protein
MESSPGANSADASVLGSVRALVGRVAFAKTACQDGTLIKAYYARPVASGRYPGVIVIAELDKHGTDGNKLRAPG